jgi:hypothetical protein
MITGVVGSSQYVVPLSSVKEVTFGSASSVGAVQPAYDKSTYFVWDTGASRIRDAEPFPTNTWTDFSGTLNSSTARNNNLTYENGRFFYCNAGDDLVYSFADVSSSVTTTTLSQARIVKWVPQMNAWMCVGTGGVVHTSTNGTTWTSRTPFTANGLQAMATDGTTLVVAGSNGVMYSTTSTNPASISWTSRTSSFGTSGILSLHYSKTSTNSNKWMASGAAGTAAYSSNGTTWTQKATGAPATQTVIGLTYHMGRWICVTVATTNVTYLLRSDTNDPSSTWTTVSSTETAEASRIFSDGKYILWSVTGGKLKYSR